MTSRTVVSGSGNPIEIVTDDDWASTAGVGLRSLMQWSGSKPLIVRELWEHGPATEKSGLATGVLYERIQNHYPDTTHELASVPAVNGLIGNPANAAAFKREIRGRRCFAIELVAMPEVWYRKLRVDLHSAPAPPINGVPVLPPSEPEEITSDEFEAIILPDPPEEIDPLPDIEQSLSPAIEVDIAGQVAMELLTRVVEIIHAGGSPDASGELRRLRNDLVHSQGLLAQRLEENERYRKQLRDIGDELKATKFERDGLRQRLRQTETNLTAALNGESAHAVTAEVMKRVDRIMRETPTAKGA